MFNFFWRVFGYKTEVDENEESESAGSFKYSKSDIDLDCRGTYDKHDTGCQECDYQKECKTLQKEFDERAEAVGLDINGMMADDIEKGILKLESEKKPSGKQGKAGKVGKAGKAGKKRDLPF